jgi:hypothetical protein
MVMFVLIPIAFSNVVENTKNQVLELVVYPYGSVGSPSGPYSSPSGPPICRGERQFGLYQGLATEKF